MPENEVTKTPGVLAAAGVPEAGQPNFHWVKGQEEADAGATEGAAGDNSAAGGQQAAGTAGAQDAGANGQANPVPGAEPNFDQIKEYLKTKGIAGFENEEDLKGLITKATAPAPKDKTPEELAAEATALDKKMLDLYVGKGGKVEDYVAIKTLSTQDAKELALAEVRRELKSKGFSDAKADEIMKQRYFLDNPDEWTREVGEDDDTALEQRKADYKKKAEYGAHTLEARGLAIRKQAEGVLNGLRDDIKADDILSQEEAKFSSKVDEFVSQFPRKLNLELGEVNNQKIDPVPFEIPEAVVTEVATILKDPSQRQQFFFNQDNSLNLANVGRLMAVEKYLTQAVKASYLEGSSRQVQEFEKVFGKRTPNDLGVGGNGTQNNQVGKRKGVIASAGQPEHVVRKTS